MDPLLNVASAWVLDKVQTLRSGTISLEQFCEEVGTAVVVGAATLKPFVVDERARLTVVGDSIPLEKAAAEEKLRADLAVLYAAESVLDAVDVAVDVKP